MGEAITAQEARWRNAPPSLRQLLRSPLDTLRRQVKMLSAVDVGELRELEVIKFKRPDVLELLDEVYQKKMKALGVLIETRDEIYEQAHQDREPGRA